MRTASDSLYDDLQQFGTSRGTRSRFSNTVRRAGSLETCGFKQRFWSLLGLRPKATRARGRGTLPAGGSDPSAASGGCRGVSEWQRSKFQASAVRKHRNFGHRNSVPFRNKAGRRGRRPLRVREGGVQRKKRAGARGTFPSGGKYTGGGKKIVRSGKKILIFPVLSCKI